MNFKFIILATKTSNLIKLQSICSNYLNNKEPKI